MKKYEKINFADLREKKCILNLAFGSKVLVQITYDCRDYPQ